MLVQIHKTNKNITFSQERERERKDSSFHCKSFAAIKTELDSDVERHRKTNQINDAALLFTNSNKIE